MSLWIRLCNHAYIHTYPLQAVLQPVWLWRGTAPHALVTPTDAWLHGHTVTRIP